MLHENSPKIRQKYYCELCDYTCFKISDFKKHNNSKKHNATFSAKNATKNSLLCECGKEYKHSSSFYRHKKKCTINQEINDKIINQEIDDKIINQEIGQETNKNEDMDYKQMVLMLLNENRELQKSLLDQNKSIADILPNIGNTTHTNSHNTTNNNVNIHLFLNEQCKDALNIKDFIQSLELNTNDLIETGKLGYVNGMTRIFVNALNGMDITERPIHCTDIKRETVYIKDDNKWEKDEEENPKLKKTIRELENKNIQLLPKWQKENPNHIDMSSDESEEFMNLSLSVLGGNEDKEKLEKKILKNVLKEVTVEKSNII